MRPTMFITALASLVMADKAGCIQDHQAEKAEKLHMAQNRPSRPRHTIFAQASAHLEPVPEAAPPHMAPGPPLKGTMSGSSLSGGSRLKGARSLPAADALRSESGVAGRCSLPRLTGWSHRLGSAVTPALAMCAASRSYCVL